MLKNIFGENAISFEGTITNDCMNGTLVFTDGYAKGVFVDGELRKGNIFINNNILEGDFGIGGLIINGTKIHITSIGIEETIYKNTNAVEKKIIKNGEVQYCQPEKVQQPYCILS